MSGDWQNNPFVEAKGLTEKIAQIVHAQWSIWHECQTKKAIEIETETVFDKSTWAEWTRKANTRYQDLTKEEQASDIEIAEKLWLPFLVEVLSQRKSPVGVAETLQAKIEQLQKELDETHKNWTDTISYYEKKVEAAKTIIDKFQVMSPYASAGLIKLVLELRAVLAQPQKPLEKALSKTGSE